MTNLVFPDWDKNLFLYLNGMHTNWLDPIMKALSSIPFWIPFYVLLIGWMIYRRRTEGVYALLFIGLAFGLTDQLSVHLFKNVFQRLRPCHDPEIQSLVYSLENCGGRFGFISNHAANTFSLALFSSLFWKNKYFSIGIFIWATAVSYSRIYVGKHFPLDVLCGAAFGLLCGWVSYLLFVWSKNYLAKKKNTY